MIWGYFHFRNPPNGTLQKISAFWMQNQDPLKGPFFKGLLQDAAPEPHKSSNSLVVRKAHGAMLVSTHFHHTVGGCEILHHQTDAWNILKPYKLWINGMFTTYRCRTSQPSFFYVLLKGKPIWSYELSLQFTWKCPTPGRKNFSRRGQSANAAGSPSSFWLLWFGRGDRLHGNDT